MRLDGTLLARGLAAIDEANAADPNVVVWRGEPHPRAQLQGELASAWLRRLRGDGADDALRLAVRAHHVRRWTIPRASYPDGRAGYLRWRRDLKDVHAATLAELLAPLGVDATVIARAQALVRKEGLARPTAAAANEAAGTSGGDPDAQTLEDCACLVFVQTQYDELLGRLTDDDHVVEVVRKTLRKMSPAAVALAAALPASSRGAALLARAAAVAP